MVTVLNSEQATKALLIALAIGGVIGGPLLVGAALFVFFLIRAPIVQRNEARALLARAVEDAANARNRTSTDRVALLREAYRTGTAIRRGLWADGAPADIKEVSRARDRAWSRATEWASETYRMLLNHYPGPRERAFFGGDQDDYGLGALGLRLRAASESSRGVMPDSWLDTKLAVLSDLLGEVDGGRIASAVEESS